MTGDQRKRRAIVGTNSELLLAGYDAWNRDDLDGYLELLHPDVHISTAGVFPDLAPEYSGRKGAARFWGQMHEPWEWFEVHVEHIEDEGDWAVASIRFRGRGVDSGVEVDMRFGMAMRAADGLGIQFLNRSTFDEARKAMLSQDPEPVVQR
jgi:ketosteroid isomerase-like protein